MRKILLFICGIMMISSVAMAEETTVCANGGGEIVKGNNGTLYCKSKNVMNWWTALGWCQAIGKTPIHYPSDCRCVGERCPTEMVGCPNFKGLTNNYTLYWTSTPEKEGYAYGVECYGGSARVAKISETYMKAALCK